MRRLSRPILLVTIAPELPGSEAFIRAMSEAGKIVAIGHSAADADNGGDGRQRRRPHVDASRQRLPQILPKLDNTLFAQLAERDLSASFIVDGVHLPQPALRAMIRAKGIARSILVTDAVSAAATKPGIYDFAGMTIEHGSDGSVRSPGGRTLAGSAITMDGAIRKIVEWDIADAKDALAMASDHPFNLIAPALQRHGVSISDHGQVLWSDELQVLEVRLGDEIYRRTK